MAERIHARLAHWVRLKDMELAYDLDALGERFTPETRERARQLFARVLDSTGGGLRILTIHAFAQSLLAAFPAEAGLSPGFRPLERREEQQLARSTLADLLVKAEAEGRTGLIRDLQALSLRLGEGGAEAFLMACARAPEAMEVLGPASGIESALRHAFGLPIGDLDEVIANQCCDDVFDIDALKRIARINADWGTGRGLERAGLCEQWLAATPKERVETLEQLHEVWAKSDGEARSLARGHAPQDPEYAALVEAAFECCARLIRMRSLASTIALFAAGLRCGQAFAFAYQDSKRATGTADFDDLIRWTERLLKTPGMGDWVRFKLDQQIDHILVDEAQDTNERQWNIVRYLAMEFFAGEGANPRRRTIFTVGDFKQAIFGFQGTNPSSFDHARAWFSREAARAGEDFLDLSVDCSFRSAPQILDLVDRVLDQLGSETLGLPARPNPHEAYFGDRKGSVLLWNPLSDQDEEEENGEEGWITETVRLYATRLARQIRQWLDQPFWLECHKRALRPEDILILVRRRGDLASLIVARLHAEGVPVAGVDRLLLSAPIAVRDLLAAARFAVQPLDDLNLASLLVSPLLGWSQEQLYRASRRRTGPLWPHLRSSGDLEPASLDPLHVILGMADFAGPHLFLETLLSGPLGGREKLLERLGPEARDPIEELLSAALEYESSGRHSLESFLDWFARGDVEIVRDPSAPQDSVRVMTVHGSKGLQSPVLIIADACADPGRLGPNARMTALPLREDVEVPVFRPRKTEVAEPLQSRIEEQDRLDREEHWRLLYVAMTRAQERLYVGGTLSSRDRVPPEASWYRAIESALESLGASWEEDPLWGRSMRLGPSEVGALSIAPNPVSTVQMPQWAVRPAPAEERPPRPLAPSSIGQDDVAAPPPGPDQRQAARRGKLLHQLFERLPEVARGDRRAASLAWLEHSAGVSDEAFRHSLADDACRIIEDPAFAELFGSQALAEAPVAATIGGGVVVAGTIDRLLVTEDRILIADFKTGRRTPADPDAIPVAHLRQMAAYREALRTIFPDRPVEAALLYTSGPVLHVLPDSLLDRHLPTGG